MAAINRVTDSITSTLELQGILDAAVREIGQIFNARSCGIALLNPEKTEAIVAAEHAVEGEPSAKGLVIPVQDNPSTLTVLETGKPLVVSQAQTNPLTGPIHSVLKERNTHSLLIVPLRIKGEVIGSIGLDTTQPDRTFTQTEVELVETIAGQIASAVENANLFEQTQTALADLKQAEIAVKESEKQYRDLYQNAPLAYITVDAENCIQSVNVSAIELFTQGSRELIGRSFLELYPDTPQGLEKARQLAARIRAGNIILNEEMDMIRADGAIISASLRISPIQDTQEKVVGTQIVIEDITERKQAEVALQEAFIRTQSLHKISETLATNTDQTTVFEIVLGQYLRLLNVDQGGLMIFDKSRSVQKVTPLYVRGKVVSTDLAFPLDQDLVAAHLQQYPEPLVVADAKHHELTKDNQALRGEVEAILFIPLLIREEIIGVLGADATTPDRVFSDDDVEIGLLVADQLAIWLENRQLLSESQHRSYLLQTGAEVSRTTSSILNEDELINYSVNLIRDQFDFYYVGLFLIDQAREWAVLRSGTGAAGRRQLAKGHRLKVGGDSMIGWSVKHRQARIALDVGEDAVHFENPDLPDTRSEMALPLLSRSEVIGALTVAKPRAKRLL